MNSSHIESLILCIDTSSPTGSLALGTFGRILAELTVDVTTTHSESLLSHIDFLFKAARKNLSEIDAVAVTSGPGSFTGIRIGLATAKGICYAQKKPLFTFSSLQLLAQNLPFESSVCPILNAQKNEIYAAIYQYGRESVAPMAVSPDKLTEFIKEPCVFVGSGFTPYHHILRHLGIAAPPHLNAPRAAAMLTLIAQTQSDSDNFSFPPFSAENLAAAHPLYLRKSEAEVQWEKRKNKMK